MRESKEVFIISGKSPLTQTGGLGAYSYSVGKVFHSLGYKVRIFGYSDKDEIINKEFFTICHVKSPLRKMLVLSLPITSWLIAKRMKKVILSDNIKSVIVYGCGYWGIAGVYFRKLLKGSGLNNRIIAGYFSTFRHDQWGQVQGSSIRDYGLIPFFAMNIIYFLFLTTYSRIERNLLKNIDRIIVHYNSTKNIILDEFKCIDPAKISKIPYYVELYSRQSDVTYENNFQGESEPIIGVICRQDPRKGISWFIKAIKILKDKGMKFKCFVAGDGILLRLNQNLSKRLGLDDKIQFMGFVDDVEPYLKASDVYVLPTIEEGSGAISLLEAMKAGVPIVTTLCDGIPEDFIDGETAMLVPMKNSEALAQAIEKLIVNPALRRKMAANVKKDYEKRFTFDKMKEGMRDILQELGEEA